MCRVGYVETLRAVELAAGRRAATLVRDEWPAIGVVEIDQRLVEHAVALAVEHELGSVDALHLASALVLPRRALRFANLGPAPSRRRNPSRHRGAPSHPRLTGAPRVHCQDVSR